MSTTKRKPGTVPPNRIAIVDRNGAIRGHVGRTATQAIVKRLIGTFDTKLGRHQGKPAWIEQQKR